jgi:hypothetical protein
MKTVVDLTGALGRDDTGGVCPEEAPFRHSHDTNIRVTPCKELGNELFANMASV